MPRIPILIGSLVAFIGLAAEANAQGYYNPPPYRPDYPRPYPGPFEPRGEYPHPRFPVLRCVAPLPGYRNPPPVQICAAPRSPPGSPCACFGRRGRPIPGWVE